MAKKEKTEQAAKTKKPRKPIDTSKGGIIWVIWNFVEAALLLVAGILAIVFSNNQSLQNSILIIIGCFLIVGGFLKILMNFLPTLTATDKAHLSYDFVIGGAIELALGVTLVALPNASINVIVQFLSTFIGIILIVAGAAFMVFAIAFFIDKLFGIAMPIIEIILSLALIALGVVVLVYMNDEDVFYRVVLIIVGVVMALAGLAVAIQTVRAMVASNKRKKAAKTAATGEKAPKGSQSIIDIDTTEKKEERPESGEAAQIEGQTPAIEAPKENGKKDEKPENGKKKK
ncbi:MAG: hypothetical protein LKG11_05690 [Bacilli bacterium]|jgi:hypothetical protein|nr:hypothetical protein [Bacilli bacterium]